MDVERKRLLQEKIAKNKKVQENKRLELYRKEIMSEVEDFDKKYRFANEAEAEKIDSFIGKLQFYSPDYIVMDEEVPTVHNKMYLCGLDGNLAEFKIYIYGDYSDFMNDYDDWVYLEPYLLLIDEDFIRYIYINDFSGQEKEGKIKC